LKKYFITIFLIAFYFASAQNNDSVVSKQSGDSVLFTDFKPVYTIIKQEASIEIIDKIEYTKDEMIFYVGSTNIYYKEDSYDIFGKKSKYAECLKSKEKIFNMHNIKNIKLNGNLYSTIIPDDNHLLCHVKPGEKLTWEIHFPRLPEEIKTINLIDKSDLIHDPFRFLNIQIKYPDNNIGDKNEKELLNKMELNKPLTLNNIYFETGKSNLLDSSFTELNTLFNILKSKPKMIIQISGYTDNVGKAQDNIVLSEARAKAVKKYLSDKGIDNNRLIVKGYGSSNPKTSNDTEAGRAKNRRVEIMVLKNE